MWKSKGLSRTAGIGIAFGPGTRRAPSAAPARFPSPAELPAELKFAFASCQNFEQGLFTAYEQMAQDDLDLVVHLGDYIYEYASGKNGKVRTHLGQEIESLGDYRVRHSQYRADPLLHGMHAKCPWLLTWDDHEVDNNYASDISEQANVDPVEFLIRRANGYQAYYEMMPLRRAFAAQGAEYAALSPVSVRAARRVHGFGHPAVPDRSTQRRQEIPLERRRSLPRQFARWATSNGIGSADR